MTSCSQRTRSRVLSIQHCTQLFEHDCRVPGSRYVRRVDKFTLSRVTQLESLELRRVEHGGEKDRQPLAQNGASTDKGAPTTSMAAEATECEDDWAEAARRSERGKS